MRWAVGCSLARVGFSPKRDCELEDKGRTIEDAAEPMNRQFKDSLLG